MKPFIYVPSLIGMLLLIGLPTTTAMAQTYADQ